MWTWHESWLALPLWEIKITPETLPVLKDESNLSYGFQNIKNLTNQKQKGDHVLMWVEPWSDVFISAWHHLVSERSLLKTCIMLAWLTDPYRVTGFYKCMYYIWHQSTWQASPLLHTAYYWCSISSRPKRLINQDPYQLSNNANTHTAKNSDTCPVEPHQSETVILVLYYHTQWLALTQRCTFFNTHDRNWTSQFFHSRRIRHGFDRLLVHHSCEVLKTSIIRLPLCFRIYSVATLCVS